ncbi:MAG: trimethylamine methyltransferase family protein [Kiloniellales bacterium]
MERQGRARRRVQQELEVGVSVRPKGHGLIALTASERAQIRDAALTILATIGMADTPKDLLALALAKGASLRGDGRLVFPRSLVEDAIGRAAKRVSLPGFKEDRGLTIGGGEVHIGTGGAAVQILDAKKVAFRDTQLSDLYAIMRVLEASPNVHYGVRPLIARDLADPFELDINTAFACMKATSKPIGVSFERAAHVAPVIALFDQALAPSHRFATRPFSMAIIVHVVPPLRFAGEGLAVLQECVRLGMPLQICSAGQAGATAPVTLAGSLAQGLAECLAGLLLLDCLAPGHPCIFALMPFVSDLRSGAMTGGSGEAAIASAAAAQLLADLELPSTVSAGITESKIADAQAGYEKGYSVALAAHAGADMINLSVGMLGSIMVASPEALVIDDDMCGAILRSLRGIAVSADTLDLASIERVVVGPGHYLGEPETFARMRSDYVYPTLADRQSVQDWMEAGATPIWERACTRVRQILAAEPPAHLSAEAEARIRAAFPIRLPPVHLPEEPRP